MKRSIQRQIARFWQYTNRTQYWLGRSRQRYGRVALAVGLLLLVAATANFSPSLQAVLETHFASAVTIERLSDLALGAGSALIGATAIVTSLVLFAMQVNIERMPYGLFHHFSRDFKLLGAFALAFLLAIGIATLSVIASRVNLAQLVLLIAWGAAFNLILFLYAYRRALTLVNPIQQLDILLRTATNFLMTWDRWAQRTTPLLEIDEDSNEDPSTARSSHDVARTNYFHINSSWTEGAKQCIRHAMSYAGRYAEQGDYDVSQAALNAVVGINAAYINAKGRTFYASHSLAENPLANDTFIGELLEHLRQHAKGGVARRDERWVDQTLQSMAALAHQYLDIDYCTPVAERTHARIAAQYLENAVKSVVPHDMPDVVISGQRLLGQCALQFLAKGSPDETAVFGQKIAGIAATGCVKEEYRPIVMEGMAQLANLSFQLIRSRGQYVRFAAQQLRESVSFVCDLFLKVPETPPIATHSTFLGPYYSSTSLQSFRARLETLTNELTETQTKDVDARSVIGNIVDWADGLRQTEKRLLLAAIAAKSSIVFDLIRWIAGVAQLLLFVSNAPACDDRTREQLRKYATSLFATLDWIPDDRESVTFVESSQLTDLMFKTALDAQKRGCNECAKNMGSVLLSWSFKGGRYQTGWGILEWGLCGCLLLALTEDSGGVSALKSEIRSRAAGVAAPERKVLQTTARNLLERASNTHGHGHWSSSIEQALSEVDHKELAPLLREVAGILSSAAERGPSGGGV